MRIRVPGVKVQAIIFACLMTTAFGLMFASLNVRAQSSADNGDGLGIFGQNAGAKQNIVSRGPANVPSQSHVRYRNRTTTAAAPPGVVREPPVSEIQEFLSIVVEKRRKCLAKQTSKPVGVCAEVKILYQLETLAKAYIQQHKKADAYVMQNDFFRQEDIGLRNELRAIRSPASYEEAPGCYKKVFLQELLTNYGVNVNGSALFSKKPVGTNGGVCWTNSKRKKEATITLCDYPLAIFIKTMGGVEHDPEIRDRQYLFSLNGCDLVAVDIHDDSRRLRKETFLTYDQCRTLWNKRTADAAMTPVQVKTMEDTIGACFREHLLPPRAEKNGRVNPNLPPPPEAHMDQPPLPAGP